MRQLAADNLKSVRRWVGSSRDWLTELLAMGRTLPQVVAVIAMGSAVRERGHRRSDFDLLLVYHGKRPRLKAPMEVDVRFAEVERLDELVGNGDEIVCWALKFGVALYDPENRWERLYSHWLDRIPLPSAFEAKARAIQATTRAREMLEVNDESAADDLVLAALTQFARERLIEARVFPASRPELPVQLRALNRNDRLATLLETAMFGNSSVTDLVEAAETHVF